MTNNENFKNALKVFEQLLNCIQKDDRKAQMELYSNDLRYEFPFAIDRPRLIEGKQAFWEVMFPLWQQAREYGIKVSTCKYEFHATDQDNLYFAEFILDVEKGDNKKELAFVQVLRIHNSLITQVREYFSPSERKKIIN